MSNSPRVRQLPPRPRITLPVPGQYAAYPQTPMTYVGTPFGQTPIPMTPISGQPHVMYANKASAFMFTQFRGIKDWTKSGLSVGEKSAFWLYEKVSSWSKRWFTHIFLFLVVFVYSVVGALIFITVEGSHENQQRKNMERDRDVTLTIIRTLRNESDVIANPDLWMGRATNQLKKYESQLFEAFKDGSYQSLDGTPEPVWTFWNAVFYCGTIYTTIGDMRGSLCVSNTNADRGVCISGPSFVRYLDAAAKQAASACRVTWWWELGVVLFLSRVRRRRGGRGIVVVDIPSSVMEDSYTVHRRRKAAARKREKTPEPPRREEESGEDDSLARAKMERMVEDTENMAGAGNVSRGENNSAGNTVADKMAGEEEPGMEKGDGVAVEPEITKSSTEEPEVVKTVKKLSPKIEDPDKLRPSAAATEISGVLGGAAEPRDSDASNFKGPPIDPQSDKSPAKTPGETVVDVVPKREIPVKKVGEGGDAVVQTSSSQNGEPRPKRRTKDKYLPGNRGYGTDSSDGNERVPVSVRRKKSPEGPRPKGSSGRTQGRSRPAPTDTDEDRNTSNNESRAKPIREKRQVSRNRYSTGTEDESSPKKGDVKIGERKQEGQKGSPVAEARLKLREKRSVSRHRYPSDTDEEYNVMKKSETFPQKLSADKQTIKRSASEIKKQIIPLSDDSLIQDFAKAQEDYLRRERGIMAPDFTDENYSTRSDAKALRKRKLGVLHSDPEEMVKNREKEAAKDPDEEKSWFSRIALFRKKRKQKTDDPSPGKEVAKPGANERVSFVEFLRALQEIAAEFKAYVGQNPRETAALRRMRNCCIGELILVIIYCGLGAFVFRFTEGAFETFYKCGVKRVKRDFLDNLWNYSHNMREEDWKSMARRKLMEFEEQLHNAHEAGVHSYSGQKSWTFLNAVSYCLTVITTIGYGHISPRTMAGRAITIVYAIFGIPIFLIILADFGKLFTRGIKFLWAFVRRLYYTGSCRKVRRTGPVQEVMKGVQLVYDFATFRRPSQFNPEDVEEMQRQQIHNETVLNLDGNAPLPETPGTPAMSNFAIDDEFNLPISVAISILLGYIFVGATAYNMFEDWDFFESFYFVFISMSTIGFGDYVPKNPLFMMFSIVYLVFGLALTSMCINVVQTVLSDSFKQASQKISATIGFEIPPEEVEEGVQVEGAEEVETGDVQVTVKEAESREDIAPKAKQEDVDV